MGDDIVPRLSYGSMQELKNCVLVLLSQENSNAKRIFKIFAAGNALGENATKKLEKMLNCSARMDMDVLKKLTRSRELKEKLWPPGVIYHIYAEKHKKADQQPNNNNNNKEQEQEQEKDDSNNEEKEKEKEMDMDMDMDMEGDVRHRASTQMDGKKGSEYKVEQSAPSLFWEVVVSQRMFSDHMPDLYENVLKALAKSLHEVEGEEEDKQEKGDKREAQHTRMTQQVEEKTETGEEEEAGRRRKEEEEENITGDVERKEEEEEDNHDDHEQEEQEEQDDGDEVRPRAQ